MGDGVALPPIASPGGSSAEGLKDAEGFLRKGVWSLSNLNPLARAVAAAALQMGAGTGKSIGQEYRLNGWVKTIKDSTGWSIDRSVPAEEAALREFDRMMVANPETVTPSEVQRNVTVLLMKIREEKAARAYAAQSNAGARVSAGTDCAPLDELCRMACECKADRGGARTLQGCVGRKLREKYGDPSKGRHPQGGPRRPMDPKGGMEPEVSYQKGADGKYAPVPSKNDLGYNSTAPVIRGAPRPDISWFKTGNLWKIIEMKFGDDTMTKMQEAGEYSSILEDSGLSPKKDLVELNVDKECDCGNGGGKGKVGPRRVKSKLGC